MTYQEDAGPARRVGPAVTLPGGPIGLGPFQGRKRALLPGAEGEPDRAVLLEWFTGEEVAAQARRRVGLAHVHLLPLLRVEVEADGRMCAVSELPSGADLWTVMRTAAARKDEGLPAWWGVAVILCLGRALQALYDLHPGAPWAHGALHPANVFVSEEGEVRLLSFSALGGPGSGAPEAALGARLCGPAADVWAMGKMLGDLLPDLDAHRAPEQRQAVSPLSRLLAGMQAPWPVRRPGLQAVLAALEAHLVEAGPLSLREELGEVLRRVCPQGLSAAGELSELHVLGAWEDLWGASGQTQGLGAGAEQERGQEKGQERGSAPGQGRGGRPVLAQAGPGALALLGLGGALLFLSIIYVLRAMGVW